MAPAALSPKGSSGLSDPSQVHRSMEQDHTHDPQGNSLLRRFEDDEIHDLICVGFGPASLAIAVALHDALENGVPTLRTRTPKVRFLERQSQFAWHAGMLLPGTKMQITFIKDLATLRNPRSEYTFMNYLHRKGRLVSFTNLGTFLPQRIEYEDYMRWCASHFDDVVDYDHEVENVEVGHTDRETGAVEYFDVKARDQASGVLVRRRARNIVIAVGGKPNIPKCLSVDHPCVIHSSQYATSAPNIFPQGTQPGSVAVIGAGQSAAEVFHNIPSRFPNAKSYLFIRNSALRPSDDSPFVNEIFDPERVDDFYSQEPQTRADSMARDKETNYGVVRLELLEEIYSALYTYRIQYDSEEEWPQRILNHRTVKEITKCPSKGSDALRLYIDDHSGEHKARKQSGSETLDVDLVIVASGYRRDAHDLMLKGLEHLRPGGAGSTSRWAVRRDYGIQFDREVVGPDAGIWLQGCNESTHGLSDTLLSILATRGGEMVQNIFGSERALQENGHAHLNGDR